MSFLMAYSKWPSYFRLLTFSSKVSRSSSIARWCHGQPVSGPRLLFSRGVVVLFAGKGLRGGRLDLVHEMVLLRGLPDMVRIWGG